MKKKFKKIILNNVFEVKQERLFSPKLFYKIKNVDALNFFLTKYLFSTLISLSIWTTLQVS